MYIYLNCDIFELVKSTFLPPVTKQKKKKETLNFEYTDPQKNLVRNILFNTDVCSSNSHGASSHGAHSNSSSHGAQACWWCRHPFKIEYHIGCPVKYNKDDGSYVTEGIFCSLNCAKAYMSEKMCTCESFYKDSPMLIYNYALDLGHVGFIKKAPSWKLLKAYGGYMSIDEFRHDTSLHIKETLNYRLEQTNTSMLINTIYQNTN
jgi:hypothetical protein